MEAPFIYGAFNYIRIRIFSLKYYNTPGKIEEIVTAFMAGLNILKAVVVFVPIHSTSDSWPLIGVLFPPVKDDGAPLLSMTSSETRRSLKIEIVIVVMTIVSL